MQNTLPTTFKKNKHAIKAYDIGSFEKIDDRWSTSVVITNRTQGSCDEDLGINWRITLMDRKQVKKELRDMLEFERKILEALHSGEGTEKEQIYVCAKLFELAEYIIALKEYLKRTKNND